MHISLLLASLMAFTTIQALPAGITTSTPKKTATTSCSYAAATSTDGKCKVYGTLPSASSTNEITNSTVSTVDACQSACEADSTCRSWGYGASAKSCVLYSKTLKAMGFVNTTEASVVYYDASCFKKTCTTKTLTLSTTSSKTSLSTAMTSSSSPSTVQVAGENSLASASFTTANSTSQAITSLTTTPFSTSTHAPFGNSSTPTTSANSATNTSTALCTTVPNYFFLTLTLLNTTSYLAPVSSYSPSQPLTTTNQTSKAALFSLNATTSQLSFNLPDGTNRMLYSEQDPYGAGNEDIYFSQDYDEERYGYLGVIWAMNLDCSMSAGLAGQAGVNVVQLCANGTYGGGAEIALRTPGNAAAVDPGLGCQAVTLVVEEVDFVSA